MMIRKIKAKSTTSFAENQKKAIIKMRSKNVNIIAIPDGAGFYIVRGNTKEARQRERDNLKLFSTIIDGEEYLICRA